MFFFLFADKLLQSKDDWVSKEGVRCSGSFVETWLQSTAATQVSQVSKVKMIEFQKKVLDAVVSLWGLGYNQQLHQMMVDMQKKKKNPMWQHWRTNFVERAS